MINSLQIQNQGKRIYRLRSLNFNRTFVCLLSLIAIWLFFNFLHDENIYISVVFYPLIIFFILRQLIDIGISFQNNVDHSIEFSLDAKGWKVKQESLSDENVKKTIYSNRTDLKWVNNVEIIVFETKETVAIYCSTYSIQDVISGFHFLDEQRLLQEILRQK